MNISDHILDEAKGPEVTVVLRGDMVYLGNCLVFGADDGTLNGSQVHLNMYPSEEAKARLPLWWIGGNVELTLTFRPAGGQKAVVPARAGAKRKELQDGTF